MSERSAGLVLAALAVLASAPAGAEESIFDEENEGFSAENTEDSPVLLDPATVSGTYTTSAAADTERERPGEHIYALRNRLQLRTRVPLSDTTHVVLEGNFRHLFLVPSDAQGNDTLPGRFDDIGEPYAPWRAELGDAFISSRFGRLLLRVGQQRVVWGRTDVAKPLDLLNPADFRDPAGDLMGAQTPALSSTLPIFMAKAEYVADAGTIQAVVIPFFYPQQLSLASGDFAVGAQSGAIASMNPALGGLRLLDPSLYDALERATIATAIPDEVPSNASAGLRFTTEMSSVELGASYLFAWDRTPSVTLDPDLQTVLGVIVNDPLFLQDLDAVGLFTRNPEVAQLQGQVSERAQAGQKVFDIHYERWHVVGVDAQTYLGPLGVRADVAWTPARHFVTANFQTLRRASIHGALGLSYEAGEGELTLLAEGFWLHAFAQDDDTAAQRPLLFGHDFTGVTFGVRADLDPGFGIPLVLQAGGTLFLKQLDYVVAPQLTWRVTESTRLFAGGQFFVAPSDTEGLTLGALFDTTDQVFLGLQQSF